MTLSKEIIYQAILSEISELWIHRAGIAGIAKRAQISPSGIYNYFSSKDDLLNQLYLWIKKQESDYIFFDYPETWEIQERFYHVYGRMFDFYIQHQAYYNFIQQTFLINTIKQEVIDEAFRWFIVLRLLLIEWQKLGLLYSGDPVLQMIMVGGVLSSVMKYTIIWTLDPKKIDKNYILLSMREVVKK